MFLTPVYYSDSSFCKSKFKILKGLEALKCHFLQSLMLEKGKRNILLKYLIHFFNDMRTATKSSSSKKLCKDQCRMPPIAECRSQYSKRNIQINTNNCNLVKPLANWILSIEKLRQVVSLTASDSWGQKGGTSWALHPEPPPR